MSTCILITRSFLDVNHRAEHFELVHVHLSCTLCVLSTFSAPKRICFRSSKVAPQGGGCGDNIFGLSPFSARLSMSLSMCTAMLRALPGDPFRVQKNSTRTLGARSSEGAYMYSIWLVHYQDNSFAHAHIFFGRSLRKFDIVPRGYMQSCTQASGARR